MKFDPNSATPEEPAADAGFDPSTAAPAAPAGPIRRMLGDMVATPIAQGIVGVPQAAVGLADIVTGGHAGKKAEELGFRPEEAKKIIGDALYSEEQKVANKKVGEAKGFLPTIQALAENPSTIVRTAVESVPSMLAGGAVSRIARAAAPELGAVAAGAVGEGSVMAGQAAESIRAETADGLLTGGQAAAAGATGVAGAVISRLSGGLSQRLGIGDVETSMAAGKLGPLPEAGAAVADGAAKKGFLRKALEGVITEGALEEMPQSAVEQIIQNLALGKPWQEGVGSAAAMGLVTGGLVGGAIAPWNGSAPPPQGAPAAPPLLLENTPDPLLGFPDGTVARRSEVEKFIAGLPEADQAAARARFMGVGPQPANETELGAAQFRQAPGAPIVPPVQPSPEALRALDFETAPGAAPPREGEVPYEPVLGANPNIQGRVGDPVDSLHRGPVNVNIEAGPISRAAMLALPPPGAIPPGETIAVDGKGNAGGQSTMDMRNRDATGNPADRPGGDWRDAARPDPTAGPISRAAFQAPATAAPAPATGDTSSVPRETAEQPLPAGDFVIDEHFDGAHTAATSPLNPTKEPSQAQKDAENYKVGRTRVDGMAVSLENPQGTVRNGKDPETGEDWETLMQDHYGRLPGTIAADSTKKKKQGLDVFIKRGTPKNHKGPVFVVDQVNQETGQFDEHKVIFGAKDEADAAAVYRRNYGPGWNGLGAITRLPAPVFKGWAYDKKQKSAALGDISGWTQGAPRNVGAAPARPAASPAPAAAPAAGDAGGAPSFDANTATLDDVAPVPDGPVGRFGTPMDKGGKPFPDKKQADAHRKKYRPGYRATEVEGGWILRPKTDAELEQEQAAGERRQKAARSAAYDSNPFLTFLATHGLYHEKDKPRSQKVEFSPDSGIMVPGYGPVFRRDGKMPDLLVQPAIEEGYLPEGADERDLEQLIHKAVRGQRVAPMFTAEAAEDEFNARMESDRLEAEAAAQQLHDDDLELLEDNLEGLPWSGPGAEGGLDEALIALGFTEEEINHAEAQTADRSEAPPPAGADDSRPGQAAEAAEDAGPDGGAPAPDQGLTPEVRAALDAAIAARAAQEAARSGDAGKHWATIIATGDANSALAKRLAELPDDGFVLRASTPDGRSIMLNASAQRPGKWQLTRFDKQGEPFGDTQYDTKAAGASEFVYEADLSTLETLGGAVRSSAPQDLLGDTPNASQQAAADLLAKKAEDEKRRRSSAPGAEGFELGQQDAKRQGDEVDPRQAELTPSLFDAASAQEDEDQGPSKPAPLPNATAPEHVTTGVDTRELGQIVDEFNSAHTASFENDDPVTHLFDPPKSEEVVRLADKVKVHHAEHGWMTVKEAKARIAEWKASAKGQAGAKNGNSDRVILSLFDLTGQWSKPWREAGYQVYTFDIQDDWFYDETDPETGETVQKRAGDVTQFSHEFFADMFGHFEGNEVYGILAACPCTDFASSGARHFAAKDADGRTVASVKLVHATLAAIEYFKPPVWALENPVGRIEKLGGLPPWRLSFDPNHVGDPYTKKTLLWGRFNGDLPIAPVEPTEGSKMHKLYGGKSQKTKNARSETPEGFSYAFFMANNAADHPLMAVANRFDRLDPKLLQQALDKGMTEKDIATAVEDDYYDLNDEDATAALREAIDEFVPPKKEAPAAAPAAEPQATAPSEKERWLKNVVDHNRLAKESGKGVTLEVNDKGRPVFQGDPKATKEGKAFLATYEEALKAGNSQKDIAEALTAAAPKVTKPVAKTPEPPQAAAAPSSAPSPESDEVPAVAPEQARKQFEWRNLGQKDNVKTFGLFFHARPEDKGTGRAMGQGLVTNFKGSTSWQINGEGSYRDIASVKKAAEDAAIERLKKDGYVTKDAPAALEYPLAPPGTRYRETSIQPTMMSPDEYLSKARPLDIDDASRDNIDELKDMMRAGKPLDPLDLFADGKEDGRHRAHAAKELGIKQVPVIVHAKPADLDGAPMAEPKVLYRSVSPREWEAIQKAGDIQGGSNRFNPFDKRKKVFFGDAMSDGLIYQGEEVTRRAEYAVSDPANPLQKKLTELLERRRTLEAQREKMTPAQLVKNAKEMNDLGREEQDIREKGREAIKRVSEGMRGEDAKRGYTSVVLKTRPIDGGAVYTGQHSGMGKEAEYGFEPGAVKLADIESVTFIKDGKVLRVEDAPKAPATDLLGDAASNTEDAGAELTYNRRNRLTRGLRWEDLEKKDPALRVRETTKEKVYPRPDYAALIPEVQHPVIAHIVKQAYDAIAATPAVRGAPTDENLQTYIDGVNRYMEGVLDWARNKSQTGQFLRLLANRASSTLGAMRGQLTSLADLTDTPQKNLLEAVWPGGWRNFEKEVRIIGGNKALSALQPSTDEAMKALKDIEKGWPAKQEAWQKRGYYVQPTTGNELKLDASEFTRHASPHVFAVIGFERNRRTITAAAKQFDVLTKDDPAVKKWAEEQMAQLAGKFLLYDKQNKLLGAFATEAEAAGKARELTKRDTGGTLVDEKGTSVENARRTGPERRLAGENVTTEQLMEHFGFKGVNFGNWMKGTSNNAERQLHLNHAYDTFADLADILGVPPKAMSLNGLLGLAFGAQGNGRFAAHFVPGVNEINLTRTAGAGAVAHEWGHAVDHYFARQAGLERVTDPFLTEHTGQASRQPSAIRQEIVARFDAIVKAMNKRPRTEAEVDKQRAEAMAATQKRIDGWLRSIRGDFERNAPKQLEAFDKLANGIKAGDFTDTYEGKFYPVVEQMRDLYKKGAGRIYSIEQSKGLQSNLIGYKHQLGQKLAAETHVPQQATLTTTDYAKKAAELDNEKGGKPYWSTNLEKFARAFDAYVADKLTEREQANTYLTRGGTEGQAAPQGEERKAINEQIDALVKAIETRDSDKGVELYALDAKPAGGGMSVRRAQKHVDAITKGWKGGFEVRVVATPADLPGRASNARGRYINGVGYIVASRHTTAQEIGKTLAHEVINHHGLRTALGKDRWRQLMQQIQAAAKAGNVDVKAAQDIVRIAYRKADGSFMYADRPELEADEVAARLIEQSVDENGNMKPRLQWLKWVWAKVADFLRSVGLDIPLTTAELHGIFVAARRNLEQGDGQQLPPGLAVSAAAQDAQDGRGFNTREIQVDGKWRPIENSKGQPVAAGFAQQAAFWRWAKDTKAVDAQGRPLVLYHATTAREDFTKFDGGYSDATFATPDPSYANQFGNIERGRVMPIYMSLQKPLDARSLGVGYVSPRQVLDFLDKNGVMLAQDERDVITSADSDPWWAYFRSLGLTKAIQRAGYDGLIQQESLGDKVADAYVAFEPSQIKSATGNKGTFDPNEDGILDALDPPDTEAFNRWFEGSKIVDSKGKPLVVYHGTGNDFDRFQSVERFPSKKLYVNGELMPKADGWDMGDDRQGVPEGIHYGAWTDALTMGAEEAIAFREREGARYGTSPDTTRHLDDLRRLVGQKIEWRDEAAQTGDAFYFSPAPYYSAAFSGGRNNDLVEGGNIMPVYLSIKNPVYLDAGAIEGAGLAHNVAKYRAQGYDGAIYQPPKMFGGGMEPLERQLGSNSAQIVAFDPAQIKSATGNRGTYDPFSESILDARDPDDNVRPLRSTSAADKLAAMGYRVEQGYEDEGGWIERIADGKQFDWDDAAGRFEDEDGNPLPQEAADVAQYIGNVIDEVEDPDAAGGAANDRRADPFAPMRSVNRRGFLVGAAAALASNPAQAEAALGRAKALPAAVMDARLPPAVEKILVGQRHGVTNLEGAKAIKEALGIIASSGPQEVRALAREIAALLPDKGIGLQVDKGDWNAHGAVEMSPMVRMRLFDGPQTSGMTYDTFLHESLHAAVLARYRSLSVGVVRSNDEKLGMPAPAAAKAMAQFRAVWDEFRQAARGAKTTTEVELSLSEAVSSPDEFFVRALTEPQLQAWMAQQEYKGKTLWERFKTWIKEGLFLWSKPEGTRASWLDAALLASDELLKAMAGDKPDFERLRAIERANSKRAGIDAPDTFASVNVAGDTGRYTPQQLAAMERVGFATRPVPLAERAKNLWQNAGKKLAQGIVDQFAPIKDISSEAYGLLRLAKGASGAFEVLLQGGKLKLSDGVYDFDETKKGGAVQRLLMPLQGEHHDFLRWVAANRAEQLAREDRENLFAPADIAALKSLADGTLPFDFKLLHGPRAGQVTRSRPEAYADSLATFNEFNKNTLDMAEQSGLIDGASRAIWEKTFYVPFYRVMEEGNVRGMNIKSGVVRQQAFKLLKGGEQKLNADLLENTLMNWAHLLDAAAKNRAAKATLEALQNTGNAVEADEATARQMGKATGKTDAVVWFMDGGQKRYFVVDDPYLMTAVSALEFSGMRSPIMNALGTFKHMLTIGVTASPFFKVRNLIRDSIQAIGTSPLGANPLANIREGWQAIGSGWLKPENNSDQWFRLLAGGGTIHFGTMMEGSEARRVQALVESGVDRATILDSGDKVKAFYRHAVEPLITAYNELGNRGEAVNRAALYQQLRSQGKSHAEASLMARDTMDFSMQGSFTTVRFLTQVVPFLNARLQGLYKLGRGAAEDPARFAMVLGAVTMTSLGLLAAFGDDDDWKKREDWDRNNYWWFKVGGVAYRIPKPFEIGAIATLAERSFELWFSEEMTNRRFRQNVLDLLGDNLALNPVPQLVKPIIDVYANTDSFTGRPIESMGMERMRSDYRFTENTSMGARALSTAIGGVTRLVGAEGVSPVQIDHLIRGYFGWLGAMVVSSADAIARPATDQPSRPAPDYWRTLTGSMASSLEDAPSRYVSAVYEQAKALEQAHGTWRHLIRQGQVEEAQAFREDHAQELARYRQVEAVKRAMTNLNAMRRQVESGDGTPTEKRERLRQLDAQRDAIARRLTPV